MRKFVVFVFMVLIGSVSVQAQEVKRFPRGEAFVAFSILRVDGERHVQLNGWQAGMTTNYTPTFGLVVDFAGESKSGTKVRQYLFGPQFSKRTNRLTIFGRGLFGGSRAGAGSSFTIGAGAGLDVRLMNHLFIRPASVDWLTGGVWDKDALRFGAGVVVPFGR